MNLKRGASATEFRQERVGLVNLGRKPSELAQEYGCHDSSI